MRTSRLIFVLALVGGLVACAGPDDNLDEARSTLESQSDGGSLTKSDGGVKGSKDDVDTDTDGDDDLDTDSDSDSDCDGDTDSDTDSDDLNDVDTDGDTDSDSDSDEACPGVPPVTTPPPAQSRV